MSEEMVLDDIEIKEHMMSPEITDMLARDFLGACIGMLSHITNCKSCWEKYRDIFRCVQEETLGDIERDKRCGEEQGESTTK